MKFTMITMILFITSNAYSHGLIEKLDCESPKEKWELTGYEAKQDFQPKGNQLAALDIQLKKDGKELEKFQTIGIEMEDEVKGKQVIEHLRFELNGKKVHLEIPEVEVKDRRGPGKLYLSENDFTNLNCLVIYE